MNLYANYPITPLFPNRWRFWKGQTRRCLELSPDDGEFRYEITRFDRQFRTHEVFRRKSNELYAICNYIIDANGETIVHSDDPSKPAYIEYSESEEAHVFARNGIVGREDGPAVIVYFEGTKDIKEQYWIKDDKLSRVDGPAAIAFNRDEEDIYKISWRFEDKEVPFGIVKIDGHNQLLHYNSKADILKAALEFDRDYAAAIAKVIQERNA